MVWVEKSLKDHLVPAPIQGRDTFHKTRSLRAPSNLTLDISRKGDNHHTIGLFSHVPTDVDGRMPLCHFMSSLFSASRLN